ncbi:ABC-type efflux pump, duplicated ATPase component YbhF [Methylomonas albis]|uniref:ABC transporter ATP-binding protein n=1 Tax=Methylomonas albis TaxID=1854563 RepID=A0ABR9D6S9_9GAMM|nr:ATP-binding cassette domain-containing protein [Methylomonas albis]MBD9357939.1 ABC transporter ATP-binding protein [Methylomonas albis]CAD6881280.1 ABC-type efflux pump, duplicated ATPase component YbhF [Methylomonas albis]
MTAIAAEAAPTPLIFTSVSKRFTAGDRVVSALRDISLSLSLGQVTALVGPDGAGKTTLLRLAAGLLLPDSGSVASFGLDTAAAGAQLHRLIGYMPQRFGLYEDLSVQENLNLYADLYGISQQDRQQRFLELMRMTNLQKFNQRLAGQLSGGMKQKLGLACTLLNRPRLLVLDEPSVGVDPLSRRELWQIIALLVQEFGTTVLLSTAYMDEAERCQQVVLLDRGQILHQDAPTGFHRLANACSYKLSSPVLGKRLLQQRLQACPDLIDSVVQGDAVRAVARPACRPDWTAMFNDVEQMQIVPVPSRLEDAFIMLLLARQGQKSPAATKGPVPGNGSPFLASEQPAVIEVEQVDRWFGNFQAVKKLSFEVRHGEIFGLLGANGAGKTTTFRMLCGLLPASNGRVRVAGLDLSKAAAQARAKLGYMSQRFSLYGQLSVKQNLAFFSHAYGLRNSHRRVRMAWAFTQFGLEDFADTNSVDLPLGYKQRLALACALMHEPEILFLDEPTSGIDPLARREFWARINSLAAQGVTILVTTHFMEEAEYCDRLLIMREGDILAAGTPAQIRSRSQGVGQSPADTMEEAFIRLLELTGSSSG